MPDTTNLPAGALARPDYRPGNYLLPDDLQTGQQYLRHRLCRHNRMLHGPGVICGMNVAPANDVTHPWGVYVCPGYAIGPYGHEIILFRAQLLDVSQFLWMNFSSQGLPSQAFVGIKYAEEPAAPVPALSTACQCEETSYISSRIKDSFDLSILWSNPVERSRPFDICAKENIPCEPCPDSPYLVLAQINLPASPGTAIVAANIVSL